MLYDVIIIGAGQAGLAMGYYLKKSKIPFLIVDQSKEVGEVWKQRYDSLKLFTPSSYSSLPGLKLRGNQNTYPTKDDIAEYLHTYVNEFSLPIQLNTVVRELRRAGNSFLLTTNQGEYMAKNVVIATGPFQTPNVPNFASHLSKDVVQLHSSEYQNPSQLKEGNVLVVGAGNSGAQIAVELSKERAVYLSVGHKLKFLPLDIGSKSIFWYFDKLGIYRVNKNSIVGKIVRNQHDPIFGFELKSLLRNGKVVKKPKTTRIIEKTFHFSDGSNIHVQNVIWATGFKSDYNWLKIDNIIDGKGNPIHQRGVTLTKGLFFLGLPWQSSRASALLQGVGNDAKYLLSYMNNMDS